MNALQRENNSLKRKLKFAEGGRRTGFAMYYASENKVFERNNQIKELTKKLMDNDEGSCIPSHIENELKELYTQVKKDTSCPICLEDLNKESMLFSSCGHLYCNTCYDTLVKQNTPKCAICRKTIYPKKN